MIKKSPVDDIIQVVIIIFQQIEKLRALKCLSKFYLISYKSNLYQTQCTTGVNVK